jgi:hypothetical protein
MQLKPNETPDIHVGEKRRVTVNVSGVAGVNSISDVAVTNDNITITSPSSSGLNVTYFLTGVQEGSFNTKIVVTLSSGETPIGYVRTRVKGEPCESSSDDYDD